MDMNTIDSYFVYALSQCKYRHIYSICQITSSLDDLQIMASKEYCGCKNVVADWRLINAVQNYIQDVDIIHFEKMNNDALRIYDRCKKLFLKEYETTYDCLFSGLMDLNWLLASVQNWKTQNTTRIALLNNHIQFLKNLKLYLLELYNSSIDDHNEQVYIGEALQARKKWFPGISYDFQFDQSRKYLNREEFYTSHLENMKTKYTDDAVWKMSLFYGLTATAALGESLWRYL